MTTAIDTSNQNIDNKAAGIVSVASFNLLAPLYIRPIDQRTGKIQPFASFEWIADEDSERLLGNEHRLPRLLRSMQRCQSDFICVQELQLEREEQQDQDQVHQRQGMRDRGRSRKEDCDIMEDDTLAIPSPPFVLPSWITPLLHDSSFSDTKQTPYGIILPSQTELEKIAERNRRVLLADAAITNAIFYRSDKWIPMEEGSKYNSTTTCVVQSFLPVDGAHEEEEEVIDSDPIVISSIHLDAQSEEKRVQQLQRCLEHSISFSTTPYIPPCIIAGDYNCELFEGSCVNAFIAEEKCDFYGKLGTATPPLPLDAIDGGKHIDLRKKECATALRLPSGELPSEEQLKSWDELYATVTQFIKERYLMLRRIETGETRVAYDHDEDPSTFSSGTERAMALWHLDHILYTSSTLVPLGRWSTLEDDEHSQNVGLPNDHVPTDHLPIAASFERHPHPRLSQQSEERLVQLLNEMESLQKAELNTQSLEAQQKRLELEQVHKEKNEDESTNDNETKSKKAKKAKKKPPPEIIQHIQQSRAMMKKLKEEHRVQRQEFMNERTILERMLLQYVLGTDVTCAQWIENGRSPP
eukprot:CAMPEP_0183723134 /NCGR_PEP_ID=MMETSP0737-20130205/14834_1 /TAXON_ID=385413 /ORGANISM="Thalassiosira miniscula, Strain CCMP1093" /LENGTH=581 /DNA_ID=CAMNT_0025953387 /DNA_START=105 /DNA_END=1846 /DNA_ORIENTATION=+